MCTICIGILENIQLFNNITHMCHCLQKELVGYNKQLRIKTLGLKAISVEIGYFIFYILEILKSALLYLK